MNTEEAFLAYKDDVYRLAVSYTRSIADAEDVCQTVFLKLMEQNAIQPGKEKAWLMQVCANECRSLLRSHWWKRTEGLDETLPYFQKEDEVLRTVLALEPKYRVAVYLYYYEGYSVEEIGSLLKTNPSTISTRLARARSKLKEELKEVSSWKSV